MDFTNSELEEMGFGPQPPCQCLATYREATEHGDVYDICADCGAARRTGKKVPAWS